MIQFSTIKIYLTVYEEILSEFLAVMWDRRQLFLIFLPPLLDMQRECFNKIVASRTSSQGQTCGQVDVLALLVDCSLVHKVLHANRPLYIHSVLTLQVHYILTRCFDAWLPFRPNCRNSIGKRAFAVAGSRLWISPPTQFCQAECL